MSQVLAEADTRALKGRSGFDPTRTRAGRFCCDARLWSAILIRDPGVGEADETARIHHAVGRRGSGVAARGKGAATVAAGDRLHQCGFARCAIGSYARFPPRPEGYRP